MNPIIVVTIILAISILPGGNSQCLTSDDNLSNARDVDLSPILDFNINLFQRLIPRSSRKNFIFSPYSIWNALVLAYFGSGGNTEKQFRQLLSIGDKVAALKKWRNLEFMYRLKPETSLNNTFIVANRAYFDETVVLRHCIEDILHTELKSVDFSQPKIAAETINNFVSNTTHGTIKDLVSAADIHLARMVLINAAYFKGSWLHPFDPNDTTTLTFTTLDSEKMSVQMMSQLGSFKYGYDDAIKISILELPYIGESVSMFIIKPHENGKTNFDAMIEGLNSANFEKLIGKMTHTLAQVSLPKFNLESFVGDELSQTLQNMGLVDAFDRKIANFSYFSLNELLSLDRSVHKAFIDVNEVGTEASAATGFIANKIAGITEFNCNRPFIFVIRDRDTKTLLFMGAYKSSEDFRSSNFRTSIRRGSSNSPSSTRSRIQPGIRTRNALVHS